MKLFKLLFFSIFFAFSSLTSLPCILHPSHSSPLRPHTSRCMPAWPSGTTWRCHALSSGPAAALLQVSAPELGGNDAQQWRPPRLPGAEAALRRATEVCMKCAQGITVCCVPACMRLCNAYYRPADVCAIFSRPRFPFIVTCSIWWSTGAAGGDGHPASGTATAQPSCEQASA